MSLELNSKRPVPHFRVLNKGVREPEISDREHEISSGSGRVPENFEILERIGIPD